VRLIGRCHGELGREVIQFAMAVACHRLHSALGSDEMRSGEMSDLNTSLGY